MAELADRAGQHRRPEIPRRQYEPKQTPDTRSLTVNQATAMFVAVIICRTPFPACGCIKKNGNCSMRWDAFASSQ